MGRVLKSAESRIISSIIFTARKIRKEREERGDRRERMNNDKKRRHTNTNQGKANIVMKILK